MPYGTQNRIVGFINEGTTGTYTPVTAASFNIEFFELSVIEWDYHFSKKGKPANGNLTTAASKSGMITGGFTGKTELINSGVAGVAPNQGILFKIVGLVESIITDTSVTYAYDGSMPCETVSCLGNDMTCGTTPTAIEKKGRGIQGNLKIGAANVGEEVICEYTFSAAYESEADGAAPIRALQGLDAGVAPKLAQGGFVIGTTPFILQSFGLDLGNSVTLRKDPSKNGGVYQYQVTGTECKLTVGVEKQAITTSGLVADTIADTTFNPITIPLGDWTLTITDANISSRKDGESEGLISEELEFEVRAFTLVQTLTVA